MNILKAVKNWWIKFNMSYSEWYLSQSKDRYDFERREQELQRKRLI